MSRTYSYRGIISALLCLFVLGLASLFFGRAIFAATATLGNTTIGANVDSGDSNEMNGSRFTMGAASGTVSSMSVYVSSVDTAPNNQFQLAIYTDNAGEPGALVANSSTGTLTPNSWNSLPVSATLSANTAYWLVYNSNGLTRSSNNMQYEAGGVGGWSTVVVPFGSWPANFGPSTTAPQNFSIYATYTTGPTPTPTPTPTSVPLPTPTPTPAQDPAVAGQWGAPVTTPTVFGNLQLLHNGKVLAWGEGGSVQYIVDPITSTITNIPLGINEFCGAETFLPDGKAILQAGGGGGGAGLTNVNLFDPITQVWSQAAPLTYNRWYATITTLSNGKIFAMSGGQAGPSNIAPIPEVYNPVANSWSQLPSASKILPVYPFMYVLPDGRLAHVGGSEVATATETLDLTTQTWTTIDSRLIDGGSSVMYAPGKILKAGSAADSGNTGPSAQTAYVIDFNQPNPSWRQVGSMAFARSFHNLIALPDGTVAVTGGEITKDGTTSTNAVKEAEIWNPTTETWATMAAAQVPRLYHETGMLLADGRVMVSGGGADAGVPDQLTYEIFSPPYLFKGARPTISSAPTLIQYNANFTINTPNTDIKSVSLIAPGAVTHSTDMNQRELNLSFAPVTGGLSIKAPASGNSAPPGYYMLFIVNSAGVPSVASWVRLPAPYEDTQPPTAPSGLSATGSVGAASLSWTSSTDNIGVDHYAIYRATTSGFTPSSTNKIGQSTTTSFSDKAPAGTYYYLVTARDAAGNESPPSNEASAVITADTTPPTVSLSAPANGATVSGNVTVSATASDNVGVVGVQFKLDGINLNAEVTTAPYSTTWSSNTATNGSHTLTAVARDASGNSTTSSPVTVTVANTAPITLVGDKTIEAGLDNDAPGSAEAFSYTATTSGKANRVYVYIDSNNTAGSMVVGIYTNSASNNPGTLLAKATIINPVAGAWNSVAIPSTTINSGTTYWIAVLGPSGGGTIWYRDIGSGNGSQSSFESDLTTLPSTWSPGTHWATSSMSAYINQE